MQNSNDIELDLLWLENLINYQLNTASPEVIEHIEKHGGITPPSLSTDSYYGNIINQWNLNSIERGLVIIGMSLHLKPSIFDSLLKIAKENNYTETKIGGIIGAAQSPFVPTGETAIFLLSNGSVEERLQILQVLTHDHWLFEQGILQFNYQEDNKLPYTFHSFNLHKDYIDLFSTGQANKPDYSSQFPASRIETEMDWSDLVISKELNKEIKDISYWLAYESQLLNDKNIRKKIKAGYKIVFYGPSGTGKTLVAGLLGKQHNRDVYRIDLSQLSSKYIGETEKNLERLFKQARFKDWILFFDEGESLFGKRTQSGQSNERYGNQQVGFLLQKIEDHPGVVILATNLKGSIDDAFLRRFQKMIYFEIPDVEYRYQLWVKAFENTMPLNSNIDFKQIAKEHKLVGGQIVNVVKQVLLRELGAGNRSISSSTIEEAIAEELKK